MSVSESHDIQLVIITGMSGAGKNRCDSKL